MGGLYNNCKPFLYKWPNDKILHTWSGLMYFYDYRIQFINLRRIKRHKPKFLNFLAHFNLQYKMLSQSFQQLIGLDFVNAKYLVNDEIYVKSLKENIENWRSEIEDVNDFRLKWKYIKHRIRYFTIILSKSKHIQINKAEKYLRIIWKKKRWV